MVNKRKTIGLLSNFFSKRILDGAHDYARQNDINIDARWSVRGEWVPLKPGWDGLVYMVVDDPRLLKKVNSLKIPKVSLRTHLEESWKVIPNYENSGRLAAEELISSGVKSILTIEVSKREIDQNFAKGVQQECLQQGVAYERLETRIPEMQDLQEYMLEEFKKREFPIGFCQPHAAIAYSIQNELLKSGIRIPEDVSMVVIDKDVQLTPDLAQVPITTVDTNEWLQGFIAAEMAHSLIEGKVLATKEIRIPPKGIQQRESTGHQQLHDHIAAKTLSYIRKHFLEPISVYDVVKHVGSSRRLVEMKFREILNCGIHEELTRLRIGEAKHFIKKKELSITKVAETCGFSSVHYFSTAFKREVGLSPKQFQTKQ